MLGAMPEGNQLVGRAGCWAADTGIHVLFAGQAQCQVLAVGASVLCLPRLCNVILRPTCLSAGNAGPVWAYQH